MITSLMLASLATPLAWQQIEMDQKLLLNNPLTLSEKVVLKAGTTLKVTDIIPLDEIRVLSFKMQITPCKASMKKETSEMIIVDELYGAQLDKNCTLNVFSELGDLSKPSLFSTP